MRTQQAARIGGKFVKHVLPAILKPARALWNEVIGFLFICFAVIFGLRAVRFARTGETKELLLTAAFTLVMLWYGVSSFLRARRISRS